MLVGNGELLDECKEFAKMLGVYDDIILQAFAAILKNSAWQRLVYFPFRKRSFGNIHPGSPLQSIAVIAAKSGDTEIVNEKSNCGILVEYGDVDALAEAIIKFVTDKKILQRV